MMPFEIMKIVLISICCFGLLLFLHTIAKSEYHEGYQTLPEFAYTHEHSYRKFGGYRLGDVVSGYIVLEQGWPEVWRRYTTLFPNSIATEYLAATRESYQYDLLCNIVKTRGTHSSDLPSEDDIVVHVRIGDIAFGTGESLWRDGNTYTKNSTYYEGIADRLKSTNSSKIVIVGSNIRMGGNNKPDLVETSDEYKKLISSFFHRLGFSVSGRWERDPDKDFIFMSHAKVFVKSGGGYSQSLSECVRYLNGTTL